MNGAKKIPKKLKKVLLKKQIPLVNWQNNLGLMGKWLKKLCFVGISYVSTKMILTLDGLLEL